MCIFDLVIFVNLVHITKFHVQNLKSQVGHLCSPSNNRISLITDSIINLDIFQKAVITH